MEKGLGSGVRWAPSPAAFCLLNPTYVPCNPLALEICEKSRIHPSNLNQIQTLRTYVLAPPPRQEHQENHRNWLARFVDETWGRSTDRKETDRLKALCKRCRLVFLEQDKVLSELAVGPGRGRQGFRASRVLIEHRKRRKGVGTRSSVLNSATSCTNGRSILSTI